LPANLEFEQFFALLGPASLHHSGKAVDDHIEKTAKHQAKKPGTAIIKQGVTAKNFDYRHNRLCLKWVQVECGDAQNSNLAGMGKT
jgi:hypothetical protein